jgi:quercetin dioxygenase-like cupin family protein
LSLHRDVALQSLADAGDPDDWRPNSKWALVSEERAGLAVIVEEIAPGEAIPLHRHRIAEVLFYEAGDAEVRLDAETLRVGAGDIVIVPAGAAHGTRNVGEAVVRLHAVFPSHRIDITYLERNPAPGTEGDEPQAPAVWDTRTGEVELLS